MTDDSNKDQEWRKAFAGYISSEALKALLVHGTPEQFVHALMREFQQQDWRWRDEIAKYFPEIGIMSFVGPTCTIRWLIEKMKASTQLSSEGTKTKEELVGILDKARAKFHGLATAVFLHMKGEEILNLNYLHDLLQEGNREVSNAVEKYYKNEQVTTQGKKKLTRCVKEEKPTTPEKEKQAMAIQFRTYQIQSDCMAHLPDAPRKGDWMVQQRLGEEGYWHNVGGPYGDPDSAEQECADMKREGKEQPTLIFGI